MIRVKHKGNFNNTERFFRNAKEFSVEDILNFYGQVGVSALSGMTPKETGLTAASWSYEIEFNGDSASIYWTNTNENEGENIAVILQYGHGTGTGGYVIGKDYINPAIGPIFDQIADAAWKEVTK